MSESEPSPISPEEAFLLECAESATGEWDRTPPEPDPEHEAFMDVMYEWQMEALRDRTLREDGPDA